MRDARSEPGSTERDGGSRGGRWPGPRLRIGLLVIIAAAIVGLLLAGGGQRVIQGRVSGIHGSAQFVAHGDRGQLMVHDLTPPPAGDVYELWLQPVHSPPLPTQVLFTTTRGASVDLKLPGSLHGINQVLVTLEPAGGSLAPTHPPVIVVRLS